uniref:Uncharacterized protein n=1 Tax=Manihot esculenta TaxID=3983 RepID=A0A199UC76_MANES
MRHLMFLPLSKPCNILNKIFFGLLFVHGIFLFA